MKRLNEEKKEWDRECGRRAHDFFLPNGSKVLVGSYTNLRREGLEGYISEFNNMVKDIWGLMGDIGVEVLPFVPVVYEGIDSMRGEAAGRRQELDRVDQHTEGEGVGGRTSKDRRVGVQLGEVEQGHIQAKLHQHDQQGLGGGRQWRI